MRRYSNLLGLPPLMIVALAGSCQLAFGQSAPGITVSASLPTELNPPFVAGPPSSGGAPAATPAQAAAFAWQEFIAANWPAGPQAGLPGQRDTASTTNPFGDPKYSGPLVWETFRHKVEIFPGNGNPFFVVPPHGYPGPVGDRSFGYDATPVYNYSGPPIAACNPTQAGDAIPWVNLDETDEITLASMFAGVVDANSSPGNSSPQLIRFLAKANRSMYVYVAGNSSATDPTKQWWLTIPADVVSATKSYLSSKMSSPPSGSSTMVSVPDNTIEIKAAWRPLNPSEMASHRFHTQTVRFYETASDGVSKCFRDATWGLIALHIIQKTPSAPYFIYATFEQADNILTSDGKPVEDEDGNIIVQPVPAAATTPQVCLIDPKPNPPGTSSEPSTSGSVVLTDDPATCQPSKTAQYCGAPGGQLYYRNTKFSPDVQPSKGNICINRRDFAIPDYAIAANKQAHAAIAAYLKQNGIPSAPWLSYKLVNVQYYPYDKIPDPSVPNGSPYTAKPPYTATNPAPSSYYQANIVVETNRSLQIFSGGLSPNISTEWNKDASPHKNSYYGGVFHNMGGCMGCHGSQGQNPANQAGDFSVILARGQSGTSQPEAPALETSQGLSKVFRNRSLK